MYKLLNINYKPNFNDYAVLKFTFIVIIYANQNYNYKKNCPLKQKNQTGSYCIQNIEIAKESISKEKNYKANSYQYNK